MEENEIPLMGTAQEQLETVNEAIYAVLKGGQSYRIGTRYLTRADLALLNKMKNELRGEIAESINSPLLADTVVAVFDGR